jgi:hypothetical protein
MTKYNDDKHRGIRKEETPIVASYNTNEYKTLTCRWCNHVLHSIIDSSGQNSNLYCSNCSITYPNDDTEDLRSKSKLITPDITDHSSNPAVSYPPEVELKRKKKEVKGGLKSLAERGSINITSYSENKG